MAEIENKIIFTTDAGDAITNVADLTKYIKEQKDALKDDTASLDDNQKAVQNLTAAQNELKKIMHTSSMSIEDAMKYRRTEGKTYNDLVKDLAELKKAYRTTADPTAQKAIANNIRDVDNRLKEMDADMGSYKRNVGNYAGSIKDAFNGMGKAVTTIVPGLNGMQTSLKAMGSGGVLGIVIALASAIQKIADAAKSSEEAQTKLNTALAPFKAIGDATTRTLQKMAYGLADVVTGITKVLVKLGMLKEQYAEATGTSEAWLAQKKWEREELVNQAKRENTIAEQREIIADKEVKSIEERQQALETWEDTLKSKYETERELLKNRIKLLTADASTTENDAATNEELAQAKAELVRLDGEESREMRTLTKAKTELIREGKRLVTTTKEEGSELDKVLDSLEKSIYKLNGKNDGFVFKAEAVDMDKLFAEDEKALMREIAETSTETTNAIIDNAKRERQAEEDRKSAYIDSAFSAAAATSSILGSIADAMESSEDATEQQLQSVKGMRIAAATIDTISGAIGAFTTAAANPGGIPGMIIGAVNAAAITAAGIAQIAQIKNTKISKNGSSSSAPSVSVPTISTDVQATPTVTGISAEDTLNKIAANSKVILVESEVQASGAKAQAKTAETSFA